eukprot:evm.model.scf_668EXC.4 EVM.evm.TU.scf_668EXC.4   scf_668EXC:28584-29522(+)
MRCLQAAEGDDSLFWDYSSATQANPPKAWVSSHPGVGAPPPVAQPPQQANMEHSRPAVGPVSAMHVAANAPNASRTTPRPVRSANANQPAVAPQPGAASEQRGPMARQPVVNAPQVEMPQVPHCGQALPTPSSGVGESGLFMGQFKISQSFRGWCQQQMKELTGNDDMALVEFLLSLKGRMEVVEYIQEYFKGAPKERVTKFTREFMVRKENDGTAIRKEEQEMQRRLQSARTQPQGRVEDSTMRAQARPEASGGAEGSQAGHGAGWERVKGNKGNKAKAKAKKGQPKGQQVPAELLGFRSNFDVLARGIDN